MGVVQQVYPGSDGVVRAEKAQTATGKLERAIQNLYPMELNCDWSKPRELGLKPSFFFVFYLLKPSDLVVKQQPLQQRTLGLSLCMNKFLVRFLTSD